MVSLNFYIFKTQCEIAIWSDLVNKTKHYLSVFIETKICTQTKIYVFSYIICVYMLKLYVTCLMVHNKLKIK